MQPFSGYCRAACEQAPDTDDVTEAYVLYQLFQGMWASSITVSVRPVCPPYYISSTVHLLGELTMRKTGNLTQPRFLII